MSIEPIKPSDVAETKKCNMPDAVMVCWNTLIAKHFSGSGATIKQPEAVEALMAATNEPRHRIFEERWLDIEPIFEAAGWKVTYDRPGYNESYDASFYFTRKRHD